MKYLLIAFTLLLSSYSYSNFVYESNQSLIDLRNASSVTNLSSGDDQTSAMFNIGFNFSFYGETFTQARMATNGCLHFLANDTTCNDYTPDPLPYATYTMYPFWTDLVGGTMKAKTYNDKTVFGWYDKKEYNRTSSNNFEVIIYPNSSFEYRYGEIDVNKHDVLIGHQGTVLETYTHLFHDECSTGSTNSVNCSDLDWNEHFNSTILKNGGSLYTDRVNAGSYVDPCIEDVLYSNYCPGYWEAYDDLQCREDPQYAPFCAGYNFEQDVGYYEEPIFFDYGFQQQDHGYPPPDSVYIPEANPHYEPDFFQGPTETFYESASFYEPLFYEIDIIHELVPLEEFLQVQTYDNTVMQESPEEIFHIPHDFIEERFNEELEQVTVEEIEEEIRQEERLEAEEERLVEAEEIREELFEEEITPPEIEVETVVGLNQIDDTSGITSTQLNVVANSINAATNSVSGTTSGNDIHSSGNTVASGGNSSVNNTQSILNLNLNMGSLSADTSTVNSTIETTTETTVSVSTMDSSSTDSETNSVVTETKSEADVIADKIVAQNLAEQADQVIEERVTANNEYGDEAKLIAYIGFVPGFDAYRNTRLLDKTDWYASKLIYTANNISDNNVAFRELSGTNYQKLDKIIKLQPSL